MSHRVGVACALLIALTGTATASTTDLPPVGRSLFDQLTTQRSDGRAVQRVPYPFEALLAELQARAGKDVLGRPGLAAVLIPVGRSLQRNASPGNYFGHPRIVVAMTGESAPGASSALMRDRLFVGFQDESNIIEVISYNERAGRFEFQIVTDYRAGATPRVLYARRAVCTTCHQGGGPIFSRPSWDETNANPAIAQALSAHAKRFHGVTVARGVDVPNAIDDSVARANRIAVTQAIWQQGCGSLGARGEAAECRSEALFAALRWRLAASHGETARSGSEFEPQLPRLARAWKTLWPLGVPEPDPNIPNRDPFFGRAQELGMNTATLPYAADEVPPSLDPMTMRPPLASWRADAAGEQHFIRALGEMLSRADIAQIARALAKASAPSRARSPAAAAPPGLRGSGEQALQRALATMVEDTRTGRSRVFADGPFERVRIMKALYAHLGLPPTRVCCDSDDSAMPPPRVEAVTAERSAVPPALQPFFEHCAVCHGTPADSPPGFLAGDAAQVEASMRRCAARIRYRLSMWQVDEGARAKTPMPPPVFVASWRHTPPREDIARMIRHADGILDPSIRHRMTRVAYEALPSCREPHRAHGAAAP